MSPSSGGGESKREWRPWWATTPEENEEVIRRLKIRQTLHVELLVPVGRARPGLFVPVMEGPDWYLHPTGIYIEKAFCEERRLCTR